MGNRPPHRRFLLSTRAGFGVDLRSFITGESDPKVGAAISQVDEPSRNPAMSSRIAVVCGHGETVNLDNPRHSQFFAMLRDHRCQVEPLHEMLTPVALAEYQTVLIGGARGRLAPDEVQALRNWVAAGGSLLVLSGRDPTAPRWRGVSRPATGNGPAPASSARLVDGLTFRRLRGRDITSLDHSALTGWPGSLIYHSNCTLTLDDPEYRITHALAVNGAAGEEQGFAVLRVRQVVGFVLAVGSAA